MSDSIPPSSSRISGQYALWAVGGLLLAALGAWILITLASAPLVPHLPQIPGLARGGAVSGLPTREMEDALDRAKQAMYARHRGAHAFAWSSRIVDWIGFGLTSAITLIAGALGRVMRPGDDPAAAAHEALASGTTSSSRRWVTIVGVIAALASVMIGLSSRLQSESQREMDQAEKLRLLIVTARKDFINASTPEQAETIVSNFEAETRKNE